MKLGNLRCKKLIYTSLMFTFLTLSVTVFAQTGRVNAPKPTASPKEQSTLSQKKPESESEPSLNETLNWMRQKLIIGAGFYSKEEKTRIKISNVKVEDCIIIYTEYFNSGTGGNDIETSFQLKDIDPSSLKVEEFLGGFIVSYNTLDSKQAINRDGRKTNKGFIGFQEQDMATRFGKAFAHAIKLCASKKEPF